MKKKVLVVDDAEFIRTVLENALSEDYEVKTAENGKEGIKEYISFKPDVVLMDINMPKMHGVDALKKILEIDHTAKVIMVSVEDDNDTIADCNQIGAVDYIIKPFGMDSIFQALYNALS